MNARASENYLAISSKSVAIFWAEINWGRLFLKAESSLIQSSCRSFIRVIVPYEISKVNFFPFSPIRENISKFWEKKYSNSRVVRKQISERNKSL